MLQQLVQLNKQIQQINKPLAKAGMKAVVVRLNLPKFTPTRRAKAKTTTTKTKRKAKGKKGKTSKLDF